MTLLPVDTAPVAGPLAYDARDLSPEQIRARFQWATRRGHAGYLWPEIPPVAWQACVAEIERVTAALLDGAPARVSLAPPAGTGAAALGVAAFTSGMGPLLGYWIEAGQLDAAPEPAALLRLHLLHGRRRAARLDAELRRALDLFAAHGVRATLLKGSHTRHVYYPDPGTRPASDIDLLLAPEQVRPAARALHEAGYRAAPRHFHPYRCEWAPPGALQTLRSLELSHAENPFSLEVHDSLARNFFGVRVVRLEPAVRPWPELHPAADVLLPAENLAYLALHASEELHRLQLARLVELVWVIRQDGAAGRLDWERLAWLLRRAEAARFAYPSLALAERLAPGTLEPRFRAELAASAPARMRRVVARLTPGTTQRLRRPRLDESWMWANGPVEVVRRAVYLAWPWHTAASPRALGKIYAARLYRLLRGTASLRTGAG